ncbi:M48 family metallopeptidase [Comamonas sp. J-3]|uniref:M48 family metallopeptidase n=1 Tax=Comamonas trifloxystrobinivorans TaxID=3350256 RepID=UPI0037282118
MSSLPFPETPVQPPTPPPSRSSGATALLVAQAVAAQLAYGVLAMLMWAPLLILTALFYPLSWAWLAFALLSLLTWWLLQPSMEVNDVLLQRSEAPHLFALLDELSQQLDAPLIHEVRLSDELNAGAMDQRGFLGLYSRRRTLFLGIPLLHALNEAQLRAVIGHELGHFSRRHGRLGHWIYRVRVAWSSYLYSPVYADDDLIDRLQHWTARLFMPSFLRRSFERSRQCEYEADACAAEVAGGPHLLNALARLDSVDAFFRQRYASALAQRQQNDIDPPGDHWAWVLQQTRSGQDALSRAAPQRPASAWDTHPPLAERAAALGLLPPRVQWDDEASAGQALLGTSWPELFAQCNQDWAQSQRHGWRLRHMQLNRLSWAQDASADPAQAALDQAVLADEREQDPASLQALEQLAGTSPQALYYYGSALLARGDDLGVAQIREAIRQDRRLATRGYDAIYAHVSRHGSPEQVREYGARLSRAREQISIDGDALYLHLQRASLFAPPAHWCRLLSAALGDIGAIDGLWLLSTDTVPQAGEQPRRLHVALLRQAPVHDQQAPLSDSALLAQIRNGLEALAPPVDLVQVCRWYTTEAIPPKLVERISALSGCQVLAPRTNFNHDLVRIDSL